MTINSRRKGATFERQIATTLAQGLGIEKLKRNLEQTRSGGSDLLGIKGFSIECKHCKEDDSRAWWRQCLDQASDDKAMPLLVYRLNRKPIVFRFSALDVFGFGDRSDFIECELPVALQLIQDLTRNNVPKTVIVD